MTPPTLDNAVACFRRGLRQMTRTLRCCVIGHDWLLKYPINAKNGVRWFCVRCETWD